MRLVVYSKSTEKYIKDWNYDDVLMVSHHPTKDVLENANSQTQVIAIGGGSVIDTAKIVSRNRIIAIPTTFAGASRTLGTSISSTSIHVTALFVTSENTILESHLSYTIMEQILGGDGKEGKDVGRKPMPSACQPLTC